jgi:serine/threonine-protein kinase
LSDGSGNELAISPDGRLIIYIATRGSTTQLYVRPLDGLTAEPIPGTEGVGSYAFFSPDGESVAFFAEGKLKKVGVKGGPPITLGEVAFSAPNGSWGPGDTIVFTTGPGGLHSISAAGGTPERLAVPDPDKDEFSYRHPKILPDGKAVLLTIWRGSDDQQIGVLSLETGEKRIVVEAGRDVHYVPTGHLIYGLPAEGTLVAAPFDLARLEVTGDPVRIVEGVREGASRSIDYALSDAGTLVYVSDRQLLQRSLVWVDRQGMETPVTEERRDYTTPRLSPDGTRLSVTTTDRQGRNIWIYEIDREILTPFTLVRGDNVRAIWMRDGSGLTFHSHTIGQDIFSKAADGSTEAELLSTSPNGQVPISWSPDSKELAFIRRSGIGEVGSDWDIWVLPAEGEREPQRFLATQFNERDAMFSPDGQWIAFTSNRSGQDEVYVKRYPGETGIVQISADGGTKPVWARSGDELFYRTGEKMMVVPVRTNPSLNVGDPKLLFEGNYVSSYDVTADGQRFVMIKPGEQESAQINVVLNWFEELKRLVPTP